MHCEIFFRNSDDVYILNAFIDYHRFDAVLFCSDTKRRYDEP